MLADLEYSLTAYSAHRMRKFQAAPQLIQEIDKAPPLPPKCPRGKLRLHVSTVPRILPPNALGAAAAVAAARGVALTRMPIVIRAGFNSIPGTTGGGMASPQQPRLAAPAPQLSSTSATVSGAVTRPAGQAIAATPPAVALADVVSKDAATTEKLVSGLTVAQQAVANPTEGQGIENNLYFKSFVFCVAPSK